MNFAMHMNTAWKLHAILWKLFFWKCVAVDLASANLQRFWTWQFFFLNYNVAVMWQTCDLYCQFLFLSATCTSDACKVLPATCKFSVQSSTSKCVHADAQKKNICELSLTTVLLKQTDANHDLKNLGRDNTCLTCTCIVITAVPWLLFGVTVVWCDVMTMPCLSHGLRVACRGEISTTKDTILARYLSYVVIMYDEVFA